MSEATPGPWQVHGSHIYTGDPDRALIAQVHNPGSRASDYPLAANARLIAAAPEMLEALKGMLEFYDDGLETGAAGLAIAAIAKAEGRES